MLLKQAIEIEPEKSNAYVLLANILVDEKRYEEALLLYKTVSQIIPNNPRITTFIANTYALMNDYTQALKHYKKAMKQSPKDNEIKLIYIETLNKYINDKLKGKYEN